MRKHAIPHIRRAHQAYCTTSAAPVSAHRGSVLSGTTSVTNPSTRSADANWLTYGTECVTVTAKEYPGTRRRSSRDAPERLRSVAENVRERGGDVRSGDRPRAATNRPTSEPAEPSEPHDTLGRGS